MRKYCISGSILGTEHALVRNGSGYSWIDESLGIPESTWYLTGELKDFGLCLDSLLALNHVDVDIEPDEPWRRVIGTVAPGVRVPLEKFMPRGQHQDHVRKIVSRVDGVIDDLDTGYYRAAWAPSGVVLSSLRRAGIDAGVWRGLMASGGGNKHVISTFRPANDGRASAVRYNRFGTRTGRLTVAAGPNILTLRRDARRMIVPSYVRDSRIAYIDFAALEVRVMLYEAGYRCDNPDIYVALNDELFKGRVDRDAVKKAVISELYGSGKDALGQELGIGGPELDRFVKRISTHFKSRKLLRRVKKGFIRDGYVTNRYGRHVVVDEPLDHIILNTYVQSTGVDVALLGFSDLIERFDIVPLFVLHDALIAEVPEDFPTDPIRVKVPGYVQTWFVKPVELA